MPVRPTPPRLARGLLLAGLLGPAAFSAGCRGDAYRRLAGAGAEACDRAVTAASLHADEPATDPFAAVAGIADGPVPFADSGWKPGPGGEEPAREDGPAFAGDFAASLAAIKAGAAAEAERVTLAAAVADPPPGVDPLAVDPLAVDPLAVDPFAVDPFADDAPADDPAEDLAAAPTGPGDLFPVAGTPAAEPEPLFPRIAERPPVAAAADPFAAAAPADPFAPATVAAEVEVLPAPPPTAAATVSANGGGADPFDLFAPADDGPAVAAVEPAGDADAFDFGPPALPPAPEELPPPALPAPVKVAAAPPAPPPVEPAPTAAPAPAPPRRLAELPSRGVTDSPRVPAPPREVPPPAAAPRVIAAGPASAVRLGPPTVARAAATASPAAPLALGLGVASALLVALAAWRRRTGLG